MFRDEDGRLKKEYRKTTPEEIWKLKYGEDVEQTLAAGDVVEEDKLELMEEQQQDEAISAGSST